MVDHWFFTRHDNPYIYIPNLIGEEIAARKLIKTPTVMLVQYRRIVNMQ